MREADGVVVTGLEGPSPGVRPLRVPPVQMSAYRLEFRRRLMVAHSGSNSPPPFLYRGKQGFS